jgi:hypothetical protein
MCIMETIITISRLILVAVALSLQAQLVAAACDCGPDFCSDDLRIASLVARKKAILAARYPSRLTNLLDRGTQCVARIERAPDQFSFVFVRKDGSVDTLPWSAKDEQLAQDKLKNGQLKRYWIVHSRRAFSCCNQPNYDRLGDYDSADDVNASLAIKCATPGAC